MISSSGISFIGTLISARKTSYISLNCVGEIFPALEHFLFTYPIRLSKDFAQVFVMFTYLPCELSSVTSQDYKAAAMTITMLTTPPAALVTLMYS